MEILLNINNKIKRFLINYKSEVQALFANNLRKQMNEYIKAATIGAR